MKPVPSGLAASIFLSLLLVELDLWQLAIMPVEEFQSLTSTNLCSVLNMCRCIVPIMTKQGRGTIVNSASTSGLFGDYGICAYSAAKMVW
jgi:NADP-dependent 3-hydroxy acid dehydrogenase YdfG